MSSLERAISLAAEAHEGQVDKAGVHYILHPLRMMMRLETTDEKIVAVLHDVVEDTEWTLDELRADGFSERIVAAVDALTRRDHERYMAFVKRSGENSLARRVKLEDLRDNSDLSRIANPTGRDRRRLARYQQAIEYIESLGG